MKSIITIALLTSLALAESLPAGTVCDNNNDCNKRCLYSQWTIASHNGHYVFVCDPDLADTAVYYTAVCRTSALGVLVRNPQRTASACSSVGGKNCDLRCVVTGSIRAPDATRALWKKACVDAGAVDDVIETQRNEEIADGFAGCE
jgi:hypothetical protein